MNPIARALVAVAVLAAIAAAPAMAAASGDSGIARVHVLRGDVAIVRADSGDTVAAAINAPIAIGDEVTTQAGARAEIELDYGTLVRVGSDSRIRFEKLDANDHTLQVAVGSVEVRVFRNRGARASIVSPQATLRPEGIGRYRATADSDGETDFSARSGTADLVSESGTQTLHSGETLAVTGSVAAPEVRQVASRGPDAFDRWGDARDASIERTHEAAYLDADLVGAEDLDTYGRWLEDPRYGRVWSPYVDRGWAPYHDGRFVWEPYYGWTWVAAEPWGWAPYHYGNWFYGNEGWAWDPGASFTFARPFVYRPAVVAFFSFGGNSGFDLGFGDIGWVPLAPFEPFYPWYGGYRNVTVVNNITNVTNVTNVVRPANGNLRYTIYHNVGAPGGFVALGRSNFTSGRFGRVDTVSQGELARATVVRGVLPIVPTKNNLTPAGGTRTHAVAPNAGSFAGFSPPDSRVRPFALERGFVRNVARTTYPQESALFARRVPIENRIVRSPIVTSETPIAPARVRPPTIVIVPRESQTYGARATSPWDRFQERNVVAPATHVTVDRNRSLEATPVRGATLDAPNASFRMTPSRIFSRPALSEHATQLRTAHVTTTHVASPGTREFHVTRATNREHTSAHANSIPAR